MPVAQSESALQLPLHAVAPHVRGAQLCVWTAGQSPAPLQDAPSVAVSAVQDGARQETESPGNVHAAEWTPSQLPPHEEPSLAQAEREPCGAPLTAVQVPTLPAPSQAWHWPPQAELQQTPSTQLPLAH